MDEKPASNSSVFRNFDGEEEMMAKVIIFAIVSLLTAILFLLLLHLYARLFWWRVDQHFNLNVVQTSSDNPGSTVIGRDHQRRRFIFAQSQDDPPPRLDSSLLQSIPVVVFKSTDFKDGLECTVCLSDLVDGDKARVLQCCTHGFHVECIDMWFQSHSTCPLCRNTVGSSQSQNFGPGSSQQNPSQDQSPVLGFSAESHSFPTNLLVWGDHNHVRSTSLGSGNVAESSNDHQPEYRNINTCTIET